MHWSVCFCSEPANLLYPKSALLVYPGLALQSICTSQTLIINWCTLFRPSGVLSVMQALVVQCVSVYLMHCTGARPLCPSVPHSARLYLVKLTIGDSGFTGSRKAPGHPSQHILARGAYSYFGQSQNWLLFKIILY